MDSSWFHGGYATAANNGFMCGYAASSTPAELQHKEEEEELLMSSQIQHHLNQISMHMNMDDEAVAAVYDGALDLDIQQHPIVEVDSLLDPQHATSFPSSSSSSSLSLRSASLSCSPESSVQIFGGGAPATTVAAGGQYPEVSSHVPLPPTTIPYDHQYSVNVVNAATPAAAMAAGELPAAAKKAGAFKSFARHLGPRRQPKPGACGQRMFKTALAVLSKMHVAASARYSQQQYYYQAAPAAEAAAPPPTMNQMQHMISERKRREKLNDSFHALRNVLPPGAKKDKTSILIRAREYIRSLEAKMSELEEKNTSLESRLAQSASSGDGRKRAAGNDDDSGEKVQIEITRAAKEESWAAMEPCDVRTLKIAVRSRCDMTEVVLRTLQCLKHQVGDDVSLVSMNTSGAGAEPQRSASPGTVLTMQIKSTLGAKWEEEQVKEAVAKVVADALMLQSSAENTAALQRQ